MAQTWNLMISAITIQWLMGVIAGMSEKLNFGFVLVLKQMYVST